MSVELEKAIELIISGVHRLETEEIAVIEACGRLLSENIVATMDQPPFHRSPLDGYAIRAIDSTTASKEFPVTLNIVDKVFAGDYTMVSVGQGEAMRIMTGSMLPEGCDCVIRQEDTKQGVDTVEIYKSVKPFQNYCYKGEDFEKGDLLVSAGTKLDAIALAVCASAGLDTINVIRKPRVSVISTGDELVKPGDPLSEGKIYDSNFCYLVTRLKQLGMEIPLAMTVGDDSQEISDTIEKAVKVSDAVVTTGGVSVGEKDLIETVMKALGAEIVFNGIAMKPGSPAIFTKLKNVSVLSLSGNPFAFISTFELLARPLLLEMTGDPDLMLGRTTARLSMDFRKASPKRRFVRGVLKKDSIELPKGHSSGQLRSMIGCNCLVDIPEGSGPLESGSMVSAILL